MIDWKRKLSSRKFWGMLAGFITCALTLAKADNETIVQVTALVGSLGSIVVYILAEAYVDGKKK